MSLTHYIFVRRDLPVGTIAAMVTHAAGESAALWQEQTKSEGGLPYHTIAVVLEAKDEVALQEVHQYLAPMNPTIQYTTVHETVSTTFEEYPKTLQLMAIGVYPIEKAVGNVLFKDYQLLKSCKEGA